MRTLGDLRRWAADAPPGTTIPAGALVQLLDDLVEVGPSPAPVLVEEAPAPWRERLWTVPPETRLGVEEVAEALGKSRHWVYRAASSHRSVPIGKDRVGKMKYQKEPNPHPLPSRKVSGGILFRAGDVRDWLKEEEAGGRP
jgi:predicted DNA-binding transcriptional regulator AlpA